MKRKGFAILTSCSLIFSSAFLASCGDEDKIEPLPEEDDDIILNMEDEKPISEKILDVALEGLGSGVKGGVSTIITKVGTWAMDGISAKMGLPFASDNAYLNMIQERLGKIEDRLTNIEATVNEIAEKQQDNAYKDQYKTYQETYNKYDDAINLCWSSYSTIEKHLMFEGESSKLTEDALKENLEELSLMINKSGVEMFNAAHDLGKAYIAQDISSKITQLSTYNIFDIAKYFTDKETPYEELRYDAVVDVLTNSYTYYYQASVLTLIDLNYKLNKLGVNSYVMDKNDEIVAYTFEENGQETKYLNCLNIEKEETLKKIKDSGIDESEYKNLTCKKFEGSLLGKDDTISLVTNNYNTVTKLVNNFLETNYKHRDNLERHLTYTSGSKKGQEQVTKTLMKVKTSNDIMTWNKDEQTFLLDLASFYQVDQSEFEGWCETIRKSSIIKDKQSKETKLTFREYLKRVGYVSEKDLTNVKYLVLGSRTVSKKSFDDYYNNWFGYTNAWQLMTVELDTVIDSFCANKNYHPVTYLTYGRKYRKDNNCAVSFGYNYGLMESHSNKFGLDVQRNFIESDNGKDWRDGSKAVYPTKYLTIEGLSVKKSSGKINPVESGKF